MTKIEAILFGLFSSLFCFVVYLNGRSDGEREKKQKSFDYCHDKFSFCIGESYRCMRERKMDSAFYYQGQARAFFETENFISK